MNNVFKASLGLVLYATSFLSYAWYNVAPFVAGKPVYTYTPASGGIGYSSPDSAILLVGTSVYTDSFKFKVRCSSEVIRGIRGTTYLGDKGEDLQLSINGIHTYDGGSAVSVYLTDLVTGEYNGFSDLNPNDEQYVTITYNRTVTNTSPILFKEFEVRVRSLSYTEKKFKMFLSCHSNTLIPANLNVEFPN